MQQLLYCLADDADLMPPPPTYQEMLDHVSSYRATKPPAATEDSA